MRLVVETYFQKGVGTEFLVDCTNECVIQGNEISFSLEGLCEHVRMTNNVCNEWVKNQADEVLTKRAIETCKYTVHKAMNMISGNLLYVRTRYPDDSESVFDRLKDPKILLAWYEEVDAKIEHFFNTRRMRAMAA